MIVLMIIGLLIIAALSGVAIFYVFQVKKVEKKRKQQKNELRDAREKKRKEHLNSIRILSRAVQQGEVTYTEASIRIAGLFGVLNTPEDILEKYVVFTQLAEATSHIPILDGWKQLSKKEKKQFDKERVNLEEKYKDFIDAAIKEIHQDSFFLND